MLELHETDEPVMVFDEKLWLSVIDIVTVGRDGTLVFRFRNGMGHGGCGVEKVVISSDDRLVKERKNRYNVD